MLITLTLNRIIFIQRRPTDKEVIEMESIPETLKDFLNDDNIVYLATADEEGLPHIAAAEGIRVEDEGRVCFSAWFCVKTMENLRVNPRLSVAVMDPVNKLGYQLIGKVEKIDQAEVMDGYSAAAEERWEHHPQTRYKLTADIEQVLEMSAGAHSDRPLYR